MKEHDGLFLDLDGSSMGCQTGVLIDSFVITCNDTDFSSLFVTKYMECVVTCEIIACGRICL